MIISILIIDSNLVIIKISTISSLNQLIEIKSDRMHLTDFEIIHEL
jgi:hypothetical protein